MNFIIALSIPAILFGGMVLIAIPLERFFFKTKKGRRLFEIIYKAIKDGRI